MFKNIENRFTMLNKYCCIHLFVVVIFIYCVIFKVIFYVFDIIMLLFKLFIYIVLF